MEVVGAVAATIAPLHRLVQLEIKGGQVTSNGL